MSRLLFLVAILFAGCVPAPSTCIPGQTVSCPCPGAVNGAQTCNERGSFAPCVCADAAAGDATRDTNANDIAAESRIDVVTADIPSESALDAISETCPDRDGDGQSDMRCGGTDCDDTNPLIFRGGQIRCWNSDGDCNGEPDYFAPRATLDRWCVENTWLGPESGCAHRLVSGAPWMRADALCMRCPGTDPNNCGCARDREASWLCSTPEPTRDR